MSDKKIALVTGASRGIGKAIYQTLAEAGYYVLGTATSENGVANIKEALASCDGAGDAFVFNVTDGEAVEKIAETVKELAGDYPDVLVNNAGITQDTLALRMKDDMWDSVIGTNLSSTFKISRNCAKRMLKKGSGRIINIGSVVGSTGNPGQANYVASKAGVVGMSKSFAYEFAKKGITVNVVAPGFIQTDMTDVLTDNQKAAILENVPTGALGQPEDIAKAVKFLASDDAKYITGQTIHVNGGLFMV